jgi:capsular exopolysaccharide synthesis family protein
LWRGVPATPQAAACLQLVVTEKTIVLPPASSGNGHDANYRLTVMMPKRRYLSYLRERWWVVLVCLVISIGFMLAYETVRDETYTSFGQLYLSGDVQLNTGMLFTEDSGNYYGTQIELLKSSRLQGAAFDRVGITIKPGQKNPYKVDVYQPMKTSILAVQVTGPEPATTQKILQSLIEEYLSYKRDTRRSTSEDLLSSLTSELAKREAELKAEQDKWADFQKSNNVAVLEEEGKSAGLYLAELNLEVCKLRLEHELLGKGISSSSASEATNEMANAVQQTNAVSESNASNIVFTASDTALKSARVELGMRRAERDKLLKDRGEMAAHRLNDEVARLENMVNLLEEQNLTQQRLTSQELEKRIGAILAALPSVEAKVLSVNEKLSDGQRLKNNIQREQGFYDHLLTTLQGVDLGKNVQQERLSVLQPASAARPTERYLALRFALAGMGGLFFSMGLVFVWYLLDDRFVSVRDIKDQFGEMVLGLVPHVRIPRSKPQRVLLEGNDSRSAYAECYRHLRSALLLSSLGESRPRTLLFTGAAPAEGKTTIAVNLARVLARSGLKVALADMDARGGGIRRLLGSEGQLGVLDVLRGEVTAQAVMRPTEIPGLNLVPAGSHVENAEGLFLRPQLDHLMAELRNNNDFVILDGAPILAADDAALLVPHADAVVMVVRPFYTRSRLVRQALDMIYQRKAKHVAIVLNRARKDDLAGHYYSRNSISSTPRMPAKNSY